MKMKLHFYHELVALITVLFMIKKPWRSAIKLMFVAMNIALINIENLRIHPD